MRIVRLTERLLGFIYKMTPEELLNEIENARFVATGYIRDMLAEGVPLKTIAARIGFSAAIVLSVKQGQKVFSGEMACRIIINYNKTKNTPICKEEKDKDKLSLSYNSIEINGL
jgi:hypothetical protein